MLKLFWAFWVVGQGTRTYCLAQSFFPPPPPRTSNVSFFFAPLWTLKVLTLAGASSSSLRSESFRHRLSSSTRPCDSPSVVYVVVDPCPSVVYVVVDPCLGRTCRLPIALNDTRTRWVAPDHNRKLPPNLLSPSPDHDQQAALFLICVLFFVWIEWATRT
jgi:hypothetical protein